MTVIPFPRPETALDRLVTRLGEAPMSPDVREGLGIVSEKDAAYGRMIEASIAGDDAAYAEARTEFWGGAA